MTSFPHQPSAHQLAQHINFTLDFPPKYVPLHVRRAFLCFDSISNKALSARKCLSQFMLLAVEKENSFPSRFLPREIYIFPSPSQPVYCLRAVLCIPYSGKYGESREAQRERCLLCMSVDMSWKRLNMFSLHENVGISNVRSIRFAVHRLKSKALHFNAPGSRQRLEIASVFHYFNRFSGKLSTLRMQTRVET